MIKYPREVIKPIYFIVKSIWLHVHVDNHHTGEIVLKNYWSDQEWGVKKAINRCLVVWSNIWKWVGLRTPCTLTLWYYTHFSNKRRDQWKDGVCFYNWKTCKKSILNTQAWYLPGIILLNLFYMLLWATNYKERKGKSNIIVLSITLSN